MEDRRRTYASPPQRALNVLVAIALEAMALTCISKSNFGYYVAGADEE